MREINKIRKKANAWKLRKDTTPAVEVVLSASPEFFNQIQPEKYEETLKAWAQDQIDWAKEYYKNKGRLVTYDLHRDETTPHIHLIFIPEAQKLDKRTGEVLPILSADSFIGNKTEMRKQRTSHAKANAKYGLKRGKDYFAEGLEKPVNLSIEELKKNTRKASEQYDEMMRLLENGILKIGEIDDFINQFPKEVLDRVKEDYGAQYSFGDYQKELFEREYQSQNNKPE